MLPSQLKIAGQQHEDVQHALVVADPNSWFWVVIVMRYDLNLAKRDNSEEPASTKFTCEKCCSLGLRLVYKLGFVEQLLGYQGHRQCNAHTNNESHHSHLCTVKTIVSWSVQVEGGESLNSSHQDIIILLTCMYSSTCFSRIRHTFVIADAIGPKVAGESIAELVGATTLDSSALTDEISFF